ncbi:MAG: hypothetical protein NT005_06025 [Spirochaetes bacterium]|nr:hypothetical protein [Spirochaetota bacterium]
MTRNFLVFLLGAIVLLVFSFAFCYAAVYAENLIAGILALVGFLATLVMSLVIGIACRDESGSLALWFFGVAAISGILLIWYVTRVGTLLQIW